MKLWHNFDKNEKKIEGRFDQISKMFNIYEQCSQPNPPISSLNIEFLAVKSQKKTPKMKKQENENHKNKNSRISY